MEAEQDKEAGCNREEVMTGTGEEDDEGVSQTSRWRRGRRNRNAQPYGIRGGIGRFFSV